jgi:hypothetical protein
MNRLLLILGGLALLTTATAPLLYCFDRLDDAGLRTVLTVGMVLWFVTAILRDRQSQI